MEHAIDFERPASTQRSYTMDPMVPPWFYEQDCSYSNVLKSSLVSAGRNSACSEAWTIERQCISTWPHKVLLQDPHQNNFPLEGNTAAIGRASASEELLLRRASRTEELPHHNNGLPFSGHWSDTPASGEPLLRRANRTDELLHHNNGLPLPGHWFEAKEASYDGVRTQGLGDVLKAFPPPSPLFPPLASTPKKKARRKNRQKKGNLLAFTSVDADEDVDGDGEHAGKTAMLRNIACSYSQEQVMDFLDQAGFAGKYNFVYLPANPGRNANLGYAFVNFISNEYLEKCKDQLDGRVFGTSCTQKKCTVTEAHMQGYSMISRHALSA